MFSTFQAGYLEPTTKPPHLFSSASYICFVAGQYFKQHGFPMPANVAMSRGYSIKINGAVFKWNDKDNSFSRKH